MTEPGVPDDEMSTDGLSLNWGPAPEEEPDLDALLSGDAGYVPEALRPLAGVLAALRAVPAPAELDGETAARTAFLRFLPPVEVGLVPAAGRPDDGRALLPPPRTADGRVRRDRHRHRRRSPGRGRRTAIALLGSAAAVVVGFAALAGAFSGHGGQAGRPGRNLSVTATAQPGGGTTKSSVLEGHATAEPTATPTPARTGPQATGPAAASGRQELCQKYFAFLAHPGPAETRAVRQLIALVGQPVNLPVYCSVPVPLGREPQIFGPQIPGPFATGAGAQPGLPAASLPGGAGGGPGAPGASGPGATGSQPGAPGNTGERGNSASGGGPG